MAGPLGVTGVKLPASKAISVIGITFLRPFIHSRLRALRPAPAVCFHTAKANQPPRHQLRIELSPPPRRSPWRQSVRGDPFSASPPGAARAVVRGCQREHCPEVSATQCAARYRSDVGQPRRAASHPTVSLRGPSAGPSVGARDRDRCPLRITLRQHILCREGALRCYTTAPTTPLAAANALKHAGSSRLTDRPVRLSKTCARAPAGYPPADVPAPPHSSSASSPHAHGQDSATTP